MINSDRVTEIFKDCLFKNNEIIDNKPIVSPTLAEGINIRVGFNPNSLKRNEIEIEEMINELHSTFDEGWSFVNMCVDKDEKQWTGEQRIMQELLLLGLAIGKLDYCTGKDNWEGLPFGMPYIKRKRVN